MNIEFNYGGYAISVPMSCFGETIEEAEERLSYSYDHDEEYLDELLALALEGGESFFTLYRPSNR